MDTQALSLTRDVMHSENNIAFTNMICQAVTSEVSRRLGKKEKYEVAEMLICRFHRNEEEGRFNVSIRWFTTKVEGNMLEIQDIKEKDNLRTKSENFIDEHFRYARSSTCHSLQRTSSGNITIHEWQISFLASRGWLWCAITRGRGFNSVCFCKNDKDTSTTN